MRVSRSGLAGAAVVAVMAMAGMAVAVGNARAAVPAADDPPVTRIEIEVGARGFVPSEIELVAGEKVDLVFTRTTPSGCAAQVHIPELGVERTDLTQGEPKTVSLTPEKPGTYQLMCGHNMLKAKVKVVAPGS